MTLPTGPRPRRTRLLRNEPPPDDLVLLLRATGGDIEGAIADIARDARDSASIYAVELGEGQREVLHGASVFALRSRRVIEEVLGAFAASPGYLAVSVGALRSAGFGVLPTGTNPDHFDIQLVAVTEGSDELPAEVDLIAAAHRVVELAGPIRPNPAYALGTGPASEER